MVASCNVCGNSIIDGQEKFDDVPMESGQFYRYYYCPKCVKKYKLKF